MITLCRSKKRLWGERILEYVPSVARSEEARMGGIVGLVAGAHALEEANAMAVIGFLAKAML